jgi:hypothetical protein
VTPKRHLSRSIAIGASCLVLGFAAGSAVKDRMASSPRVPLSEPVSTDGRTDPAALARSNALVDDALAKHVWNTAQAEEFHPLMLQLSALDRDTVMRRLFVAVNAGRVAMRATGLPF